MVKQTPVLTTLLAAGVMVAGPVMAHAGSFTDFEDFAVGSVNGQNGWAVSGNYDQAVVDLGTNKVWRISNAVTTGNFGDQSFSPGSGYISGESSAIHHESGQPAVTNHYRASFDFTSATGAAQDGLFLSISPDVGKGSRLSYIGLEDTGSGFDVIFYDAKDNHPVSNDNGGFSAEIVATGLSYTDWHSIVIDITFVDGVLLNEEGFYNGNDVVNVYVNDALVHTGTSWESYYQTSTEGQDSATVRAVDRLLFRASGTAAPDVVGDGFYFDNVSVIPEPASLALLGLGGGMMLLRGRRR